MLRNKGALVHVLQANKQKAVNNGMAMPPAVFINNKFVVMKLIKHVTGVQFLIHSVVKTHYK